MTTLRAPDSDAEFDLAVVGGTVVLASGASVTNVGVSGDIISAIGTQPMRARTTIDARGKLVLPGGVDSHCHIDQQPWQGRSTADDFRSGTLAALCGGNTTIIPFAMQMRGQSLKEVVRDYHDRARSKAHIDYAFHLVIGDPTPHVLQHELPELIEQGCTSIKLFLTYEGLKLDDYDVLNVLEIARREGLMIMVHAENDACIRWLTERLLAQRKTQLKYHLVAHPAIAEREATYRAISLAELVDTPILIVHVSSASVVEEIRRAQARGLPVYAETCPHYLFLSGEHIDSGDFNGAKYICSPPPRARSNQPAMWEGILDGTLTVFSSDHSAWNYSDKMLEGPHTPFHRVPNGIPGIETRLPLLFSAARADNRLSLERFVEITTTIPAKLYGLYPRKGVIAVGSDADMAIWDAEKSVTIRNQALHHAVDHTPYEGVEVKGWPITIASRGEIVFADGRPVSNSGRGRFLPCQRPFVPRAQASPCAGPMG